MISTADRIDQVLRGNATTASPARQTDPSATLGAPATDSQAQVNQQIADQLNAGDDSSLLPK